MSALTTETASPGAAKFGGAFWERLWRLSGVNFVVFFLIAAVLYGVAPQVGASPDALAAYYSGDRTRILIAAAISGLNVLNLMWFAAALRATLADAGRDGWGAAAIASSAAFGALTLLQIAFGAALAYSIAGAADQSLASGLNDLSWALAVLIAFPRAMLIMSGAFGLWRAGLISNALFAVGVAAVVLGVLGGTTWLTGSVWGADGVYTRYVGPVILLAWILVVTRVLLARGPTPRDQW